MKLQYLMLVGSLFPVYKKKYQLKECEPAYT